jgi:hypothetical protein
MVFVPPVSVAGGTNTNAAQQDQGMEERMMRKGLMCLFVGLALFSVRGLSFSNTPNGAVGTDSITATSWSLLVEARMSGLHDSSATFGVRPDATSDFDSEYDQPCPPNPPGDWLQVYFPHTGGHWPTILGTRFDVDITQPVSPTWLMQVESNFSPALLTLSWDTSIVRKLPAGFDILLRDSSTGVDISMRRRPSYTFLYDAQRTFSIRVGFDAVFSVSSGWNIVSIPRVGTDSSKSYLFPSAISPAFSYDNSYQVQPLLQRGKGYWLKFRTPQFVQVAGATLSTLEIPLNEGWNLIGSVERNCPAPSGGIIVSHFFGYGAGYAVVDSLRTGKGYWVKASSAGTLVIGYLPSNALDKSTEQLPEQEISLTLTDHDQSHQTLFLVSGTLDETALSFYEMPPPPPEGLFDARFISQRYVESYDLKSLQSHRFKIQVQSASFPLVLTADTPDPTIGKIEATVDGNTWHPLPLVIDNPQTGSVQIRILSAPAQPATFRLEQNYPNPFNPSSVIRYALPERAQVRIALINVLGKEVALLTDGVEESGLHQLEVDGDRLQLTSGVYFYRFRGSGLLTGTLFDGAKKLIFMK